MRNLTYLFAAYTFIWVLLFGYLVSLGRRGQALRREVRALRDARAEEGRDRP